MINGVLIAILLYVAAQLAIGALVARRVRGASDYLLAGRRLGYVLATFSIFATWFGAETCLGSAGAIYEEGLSAGARDPLGYGACLLLMGLVFAAPLWRRKLTTLGDLFRQRYSPGVERLAALIMVPTSVLWAAAQIRAFGLVLSASSDLNVDLAVTLAAAVVIAYTVMGGLMADAITDLVQGLVLIAGLVFAFFAVNNAAGGVGAALSAVEPERLRLIPPGASWLDTLEMWALPICGSVVAQELISRVLGSRSPQVARRSTIMATGIYLTIGLIPAFIGLIGPQVMPGLEQPEHLLPAVVQKYASNWMYIIFAGALVSAILSTVDSALLAASALTTENLVGSLLPGMGERARLRFSRLGVALFGLLAFGLALASDSIFDLVEEASAFGSAGIFTIMLAGLFTRFGGRASAYAALLAGLGVWLYAHYCSAARFEYLPSLLAALAAYALVALVTHTPASRAASERAADAPGHSHF